jgi:raffinose/stachyose/melibiose transport system permease protein
LANTTVAGSKSGVRARGRVRSGPPLGRRLTRAGRHVLLTVVCIVILFPIVYMFLASFKSVEDFFAKPYGLPTTWEWQNYVRAWDEANVAVTLTNSVIVTTLSVLFSTTLAALASYGLSQRGKFLVTPLYILFASGLLIPVQMTILPLFILLRQVGLFGTLFSIIMPYTALGLPLAILVLVPFFATVPSDLSHAARIDGATEWQVFWLVILPLVRPALSSVIILNGVWMWNDFFIPLVIAIKPAIQTLPVGIMSFVGVYSTEWGLVFASVVVSALPVIIAYVFLTRQFVAGISAGAVKG